MASPATRLGPERTTLVFTIDTEPDNQWAGHRCSSIHNVLQLAPFHDMLAACGVVPTYVITYAVATNPDAIQALQKLQQRSSCEIGAHLHVWDNPPFLTNYCDRDYPAFAHELPVEHVYDKLSALTEKISESFDPPVSYRAGRFGYCADHIRVLESLGYLVDSSVTPLIDRRSKVGIPRAEGGLGGRDYREAPPEPYHPDYEHDLKPGSATLLEVPLTTGVCGIAPHLMTRVHRHAPSVVCRASRKLGVSELVTASPTQFSIAQMQSMLDGAVASGRRNVNFTLHSSEAVAGQSSIIKTEDDRQALFHRVRSVLGAFEEKANPRYCTLKDLAPRSGADDASQKVHRMRHDVPSSLRA